MDPAFAERLQLLAESGALDRDWYCAAHPDAAAAGMEPAEHYLRYGHRMDRAPGPGLSAAFMRAVHGLPPEEEPFSFLQGQARAGRIPQPRAGQVLLAASRVLARGQPDLAAALAAAHLPPRLAHTAQTLHATRAAAAGDTAAWLLHLNRYLAALGSDPVALSGQGTVFDRLDAGPAAPVQGPLISVILPAYNAEATLAKAAGSILEQSWRNLELLIVDDASGDGTGAVMARLAQADARVRLLRNARNLGPYVSKNLALAAVRGEWVTGQDADDWSHPRRLERQMAEAARRGLDATLGYMLRITPDGRIAVFDTINPFCLDGAARKASISALFRRAVLTERLGYWDTVRFGADSEMIARAERALGPRFGIGKRILMLCLSLDTSLTNHPRFGVAPARWVSEARRSYEAAWRAWLADPGHAGQLYLPFPQATRRYAALPEMIAPDPAGSTPAAPG